MREFSIEEIKNVMTNKGYVFFTNGDYNLNIIGVRNKSLISDLWDDALYVIYKINNNWIKEVYKEFTTDPGKQSLQYPVFRAAQALGTAIMKEGQYRAAYRLGTHTAKHPALIQVKPITIYRDANRDALLNMKNVLETTGIYGLNIHSTRQDGAGTVKVHNWSAGCQVNKNWSEHKKFIETVKTAAARWRNSFTYTLLHENDFE